MRLACVLLLSLIFGWGKMSLLAQVVTPVFTDVTATAGLSLQHQSSQTVVAIENADDNAIRPLGDTVSNTAQLMTSWLTGGVAAADYDGDGWDDVFVIGGDQGTSRLFRNLGNGSFSDVTAAVGLAGLDGRMAGAVFADVDNDGDLDLFIGAALGESPRLLIQQQMNGQPLFTDTFSTAFPGYDPAVSPNAWGGLFGDYNNDGCVDIFIPHSLTPLGPAPAMTTTSGSTQHLWQGDCAGGFVDVSVPSGIAALFDQNLPDDGRDQTFAGSFVDLNHDGWQDLLITGDKNTSLVLLNQSNGEFLDITDRDVLDDFNAMGSAIADVNLDGELDWFSSNISDLNGWDRGNKLYWGNGLGEFTRAPDQDTGVLTGLWGWGACAADFNLDRYPDIFHVNGFYMGRNQNPAIPHGRYSNTPAVLFMANGDDTFTESAAVAGIADSGEGRGVACFDYDRDGDIDVAISNYKGEFKLYRNDTPGTASFLQVTLNNDNGNTESLGALLRVRSENPADSNVQLTHSIAAGSHFVSASPARAYFGLGDWSGPLEVTVQWPDNSGETLILQGIPPGQRLHLDPLNDRVYRAGFE